MVLPVPSVLTSVLASGEECLPLLTGGFSICSVIFLTASGQINNSGIRGIIVYAIRADDQSRKLVPAAVSGARFLTSARAESSQNVGISMRRKIAAADGISVFPRCSSSG